MTCYCTRMYDGAPAATQDDQPYDHAQSRLAVCGSSRDVSREADAFDPTVAAVVDGDDGGHGYDHGWEEYDAGGHCTGGPVMDEFLRRLRALTKKETKDGDFSRKDIARASIDAVLPYVAAHVGASKMHDRMNTLHEFINKEAPGPPALLGYPELGKVTLTCGVRVVWLRHHIGQDKFFIGCRRSLGDHPEERSVNPIQWCDVNVLGERMAAFLTFRSETMFDEVPPKP